MSEARGIDIKRAADTSLAFEAALYDANQAEVVSGTAYLRLFHRVPTTGALEQYDFNDHTFKTGACTTPSVAMTHQVTNNSTYNTGIWTYRLATLTGFVVGDTYIEEVYHASALPLTQKRKWQYGDVEGDTATEAKQDTLLARLGAFTGTGVNTVLGFFRALLRKDIAGDDVPSDIGGTYDPATDSQEALRDTEPMGTAMRGTDGAYTGTPPTAEAIAAQVWEEAQADHVTEGSTGASLSRAGQAGDPWGTALPGEYEEGTAGYRVGTLLDAQLSTVGGTVNLAAASGQVTVDTSGEAIGGTGDITVARGASVTIRFTALGKTLTGHSLYITCREDRADLTDPTDATALFTKACTVTGATTFSVTLTATETDKLTALGKQYWYEIRDVTAQDSLIIARLTVVGSVVKRTS